MVMLPVSNMETLIFYVYNFYTHAFDVFTCKNIFYTRWYHVYSHGCDVFTYIHECSVHLLIRLQFPWVQCIYTCKNIFYTGWYHFCSHGCDVFTCKNVLYTASYIFYSHGCNVFIHARMFFTLADTILCQSRVPIFTAITEVWPRANRALVTNNLTVIIEVVLIEGFLYRICLHKTYYIVNGSLFN